MMLNNVILGLSTCYIERFSSSKENSQICFQHRNNHFSIVYKILIEKPSLKKYVKFVPKNLYQNPPQASYIYA